MDSRVALLKNYYYTFYGAGYNQTTVTMICTSCNIHSFATSELHPRIICGVYREIIIVCGYWLCILCEAIFPCIKRQALGLDSRWFGT